MFELNYDRRLDSNGNLELILGDLAETPGHGAHAEAERLYAEHGRSLLRQCLAITSDSVLAEDALHDALSKLAYHGSGVRGARSELSWLKHVVARRCLDLLEVRSVGRRDASTDSGATSRADAQPYTRNTLTALATRLREKSHAVVLLLLQQGLTQEEIARRLRRAGRGWASMEERVRE
jgi:DNA-directed RNA polymerase specialized sigma24 family protein